jgi:hypothetical protein
MQQDRHENVIGSFKGCLGIEDSQAKSQVYASEPGILLAVSAYMWNLSRLAGKAKGLALQHRL